MTMKSTILALIFLGVVTPLMNSATASVKNKKIYTIDTKIGKITRHSAVLMSAFAGYIFTGLAFSGPSTVITQRISQGLLGLQLLTVLKACKDLSGEIIYPFFDTLGRFAERLLKEEDKLTAQQQNLFSNIDKIFEQIKKSKSYHYSAMAIDGIDSTNKIMLGVFLTIFAKHLYGAESPYDGDQGTFIINKLSGISLMVGLITLTDGIDGIYQLCNNIKDPFAQIPYFCHTKEQ